MQGYLKLTVFFSLFLSANLFAVDNTNPYTGLKVEEPKKEVKVVTPDSKKDVKVATPKVVTPPVVTTKIDKTVSIEHLLKYIVVYDKSISLDDQAVILTDFGYSTIVLNKFAPKSIEAFKLLIRSGYYNKTTFYRMIDQYFVQAGDPLENQTGTASISIPDESNKVTFDKGTIALSNTGTSKKTGAQFFVVTTPAPWLDGKYNIIGKVIYGLNIFVSFYDKYTTYPNGIITTPIPFEVYLLSDLAANFPQMQTNLKDVNDPKLKDLLDKEKSKLGGYDESSKPLILSPAPVSPAKEEAIKAKAPEVAATKDSKEVAKPTDVTSKKEEKPATAATKEDTSKPKDTKAVVLENAKDVSKKPDAVNSNNTSNPSKATTSKEVKKEAATAKTTDSKAEVKNTFKDSNGKIIEPSSQLTESDKKNIEKTTKRE